MNIEYDDFRWGAFIDFKDEFLTLVVELLFLMSSFSALNMDGQR